MRIKIIPRPLWAGDYFYIVAIVAIVVIVAISCSFVFLASV